MMGAAVVGWLLYQGAFVREMLVSLAGKFGPTAVPYLRHSLHDESNDVRRRAIETLREIGADAAPSLIDSLSDGDPQVRQDVAFALGLLNEKGKAGVPRLVELVESDPELRVRIGAMRAFQTMRGDALPAVPVLIKALKDPEAEIRVEAAESLGRIAFFGDADEAVVALIASLQEDRDANVRSESTEALGRIASKARNAIPALLKAKSDPDEGVRQQADEAIQRIESAVRRLSANKSAP
jgi:HEAT repeat protein